MKMNRLFITSALLLGSLSALGIGVKSSKEFEFEVGEMNEPTVELARTAKRAADVTPGETVEHFVPNGESQRVSQAIAQKVVKKDGTVTMRFVSAVKVDKVTRTEAATPTEKPTFDVVSGGHFGFRIGLEGASGAKDFPTTNFYMSLQAGTQGYYANDKSTYFDGRVEFKNKDMNGFLEDAFGVEEKNILSAYGFNAFITMEVRGIDPTETRFIQAQPYYYAEEESAKEFAKYTKKADVSGEEYLSAIVNNEESSMKLKNQSVAKINFKATWDRIEKVYIDDVLATKGQDPKTNEILFSAFVPVDSSGKNTKLDIDFRQDNVWVHSNDVLNEGAFDKINENEKGNYLFSDSKQTYNIEAGKTYNIYSMNWIKHYGSDKYVHLNIEEAKEAPLYNPSKTRYYSNNLLEKTQITIKDSYGRELGKYVNTQNALNNSYNTPKNGRYTFICDLSNKNIFVQESEKYLVYHKDVISFKPNDLWDNGEARFAVNFFGNGYNDAWADLKDDDGDGIYECVVPQGKWNGMIFCRMNKNAPENTWGNKWNQTINIYANDGVLEKVYSITDAWGNDANEKKATGEWINK